MKVIIKNNVFEQQHNGSTVFDLASEYEKKLKSILGELDLILTCDGDCDGQGVVSVEWRIGRYDSADGIPDVIRQAILDLGW